MRNLITHISTHARKRGIDRKTGRKKGKNRFGRMWSTEKFGKRGGNDRNFYTHPHRVAAFDVSRGKLRFRRQVRIVLSQRLLKLQFYRP